MRRWRVAVRGGLRLRVVPVRRWGSPDGDARRRGRPGRGRRHRHVPDLRRRRGRLRLGHSPLRSSLVRSRVLLRGSRGSLVMRDGGRLLGPPGDHPLELRLLPASVFDEPLALPRETVHRLREPAVERQTLLQPGRQLPIVRNRRAHRGRVGIRRGSPRVDVVHLREPRVRRPQPR